MDLSIEMCIRDRHIKQDYNNELQNMNEHVNGAVQLFINSLPILDSNGTITPKHPIFSSK